MERSILHQIGWSPMPFPTLSGLFHSTGLLQSLPAKCMDTLEDIILSCYKHEVVSAAAEGVLKFSTLYQPITLDPKTVCLACYQMMLETCVDDLLQECLLGLSAVVGV